ncbi:hypothetical protein D3C78_1318120 [compost metagenome]
MTADNVMIGIDLRSHTPSSAPTEPPNKNSTTIHNTRTGFISVIGKSNVIAITASTRTTLAAVCKNAVTHLPITNGRKPIGVSTISLLVRSSHSRTTRTPVLTMAAYVTANISSPIEIYSFMDTSCGNLEYSSVI